MRCNLSDYDFDINPIYNTHEIWLSDGNIQDLNALFDVGAGLSAIAEALVTWGALEASTPPGVGTFIAGVLLVEKGVINFFNDGCGVKVTIYLANFNTAAFQTVSSQ